MQFRLKSLSFFAITIVVLAIGNSTSAQPTQNWQIIVPDQLQNEEAVKVALNDLQTSGNEIGIHFQITDDKKALDGPAIIVGDASTNKTMANISKKYNIDFKGVADPQGYEIITK